MKTGRAEFVIVATFSQPVDAYIARSRLESDGIECRVEDDHIVSIQWFYSNAVGGVKLLASEADAQRAKDILQIQEPLAAGREDSSSCLRGRVNCRTFYLWLFLLGPALIYAIWLLLDAIKTIIPNR